jgi:hypothetical protein
MKGWHGDQRPAGAYRNGLVYGERGFRGQSAAQGPHASNFKTRGVTSPGHMGSGVAGNMTPKSFKLTGARRHGTD